MATEPRRKRAKAYKSCRNSGPPLNASAALLLPRSPAAATRQTSPGMLAGLIVLTGGRAFLGAPNFYHFPFRRVAFSILRQDKVALQPFDNKF